MVPLHFIFVEKILFILPMDKKLFNESTLSRNVQAEILEKINEIESTIPPEIFESIFNSENMKEFLNSVELPKYTTGERKSELFAAIKKKERMTKKHNLR